MIKSIAVIGSGVSGLVSANLLSDRYSVSLFEAADYLGGHTHTVDVADEGNSIAIDTGFIVFNKKTYPNFCRLLQKHNVAIQLSEMSFSYRSDSKNLEYNGHSLNTLFADRRNLFKPQFYRLVNEIVKFNRDAKNFLLHATKIDISIAQFMQQHAYSDNFISSYLSPMIAAIWSKTPTAVLNSSAHFILQFYENHGLLDIANRPPWYVISGGSRSYIAPLIKNFKQQIFLNTKIINIERNNNKVILKSLTDSFEFDAVIIATHSDQALKMLAQPDSAEQEILAAIPYTENDVILHTDTSIMPKHKLAWASWNYLDTNKSLPTLTYYMNRLQTLTTKTDFLVSVNLREYIAPEKIISQYTYAHPNFSQSAIKAQQQLALINGRNNTYFAGAYWGYGFHEDGVKSAIAACAPLGVTL